MIKGFTLLEMLISLAVFTIAIFIILATLFSVFSAQRKAAAIQAAQDNLRFAFEHMTKEIRAGRVFHCGASGNLTQPQNCTFPSGSTSFTFMNDADQTVTYQIFNCGTNCSQLVKSSNGTLPCNPDPDVLIDCQKITAPEVVIVDRIAFYTGGPDSPFNFDGQQDRVTIVLEGRVQDPRGAGTTEINLQTTVSKRSLTDYP